MFVKNKPALKIKDKLIIADLHIGIEKDFWKKNINIPKQTEKLVNKVNSLIKTTKAKEVVILGDLRNSLYQRDFDKKEIEYFLEKISKKSRIILIKGNHDGLIEDFGYETKKFYLIGDYLLTHGHLKIPEKYKNVENIIIGHNHPGIKFKDDVGVTSIETCWLISENEKKIIMMPAFNPLCGIQPLNNEEELMGPIAKNIKKSKSKIYLLDGTYIGKLNQI